MTNTIFETLRDGYTEPIRDPLWGHVYMRPGIAALIRSAPFSRLFRIFQLGPAYLAYPGATHTRAGHSIGVYHLGRRLLLALAEKGADSWLSPQGALSFLCASLLHDLGHFPYTHSLKELPLSTHEELTAALILQEPLKSLIGSAGADPYLSAAIVGTSLPNRGSEELIFYRRLLSGALDPDKLDYLNRDARYCGVPYGAQDVDFIFSRLYPHRERGVDIDSRGIPSVEAVLFSKYLMYRNVYWHRQVRSATAMIKKSLVHALKKGSIPKEGLYHLDDQELFALLDRGEGGIGALPGRVRNGDLFVSAAEFPYNSLYHAPLDNVEERHIHEASLAELLSQSLGQRVSPEEVIIDLPEPINFETSLLVRDEDKPFHSCSAIFKKEAVDTFVDSLRIIRIFIDPIHEKAIKSLSNREGILYNSKNWLE